MPILRAARRPTATASRATRASATGMVGTPTCAAARVALPADPARRISGPTCAVRGWTGAGDEPPMGRGSGRRPAGRGLGPLRTVRGCGTATLACGRERATWTIRRATAGGAAVADTACCHRRSRPPAIAPPGRVELPFAGAAWFEADTAVAATRPSTRNVAVAAELPPVSGPVVTGATRVAAAAWPWIVTPVCGSDRNTGDSDGWGAISDGCACRPGAGGRPASATVCACWATEVAGTAATAATAAPAAPAATAAPAGAVGAGGSGGAGG
jgi:hypothetical protein